MAFPKYTDDDARRIHTLNVLRVDSQECNKQLRFINEFIRQHPSLSPVSLLAGHRCSSSCSYWSLPEYVNYFVCIKTGMCHICTPKSCGTLRDTNHNQVCSTLGIVINSVVYGKTAKTEEERAQPAAAPSTKLNRYDVMKTNHTRAIDAERELRRNQLKESVVTPRSDRESDQQKRDIYSDLLLSSFDEPPTTETSRSWKRKRSVKQPPLPNESEDAKRVKQELTELSELASASAASRASGTTDAWKDESKRKQNAATTERHRKRRRVKEEGGVATTSTDKKTTNRHRLHTDETNDHEIDGTARTMILEWLGTGKSYAAYSPDEQNRIEYALSRCKELHMMVPGCSFDYLCAVVVFQFLMGPETALTFDQSIFQLKPDPWFSRTINQRSIQTFKRSNGQFFDNSEFTRSIHRIVAALKTLQLHPERLPQELQLRRRKIKQPTISARAMAIQASSDAQHHLVVQSDKPAASSKSVQAWLAATNKR